MGPDLVEADDRLQVLGRDPLDGGVLFQLRRHVDAAKSAHL